MQYELISIEPLLFNWMEDNPVEEDNISKTQLYRWAHHVSSMFSVIDGGHDKIAILPVKAGKVIPPKDFRFIRSIAYRKYPKKGGECTTVERVSQYTQKQYGKDCDLEINVKCDPCYEDNCDCSSEIVEIDVNKIWELENPWYYYGNKFGRPMSSLDIETDDFDYGFRLLKSTSKDFFNVNSHLPECQRVDCDDCVHEYKVVNRSLIETDIITEKGVDVEVLLAYVGDTTDEEGNLLIPDIPDVHEAISYQLDYMFYKKKSRDERDSFYKRESIESLQLRDMAIARARNVITIPEGDEIRAYFSDRWTNGKFANTYNPNRNIRY